MPLVNNELLIDFAALAKQDEDFAEIHKSASGRLDFRDAKTVQQLTKSILKCDFGLRIDLPDDRLCPPVPVRYEYIRWIQNLIDTTSDSHKDRYDPERTVIGIDIGVGASCIYPLLGCASRPSWKFGGTEVDQKNFEYATRNRDLNSYQSSIRLIRTTPSEPLINLAGLKLANADFVMCNPPFFGSAEEMNATNHTKKRAPSAVCTGAEVEMVVDGGDQGFTLRILEESMVLQQQVQWFSSMLGKLSSVYTLVKKIKELGITNWAVTTLQAGNVTKRWVVAWSFMDRRPTNEVAREGIAIKELLPFPTEYMFAPQHSSRLVIAEKVDNMLGDLQLMWERTQHATNVIGTCYAAKNVWSRSARRRRDHSTDQDGDLTMRNNIELDSNGMALGVRISFVSANADTSGAIKIRWLKGHDSVLFESFCGMLRRALST